MPVCVLTPNIGAGGYFAVWSRRDGEERYEIGVRPEYMIYHEMQEALAVLAHEMVHLWEHHYIDRPQGRVFDKPAKKNSPHTEEWAAKMKEIGLYPSDTGKPGGKETGCRVGHYILEGERFDTAVRTLTNPEFCISWWRTMLIPGVHEACFVDPPWPATSRRVLRKAVRLSRSPQDTCTRKLFDVFGILFAAIPVYDRRTVQPGKAMTVKEMSRCAPSRAGSFFVLPGTP